MSRIGTFYKFFIFPVVGSVQGAEKSQLQKYFAKLLPMITALSDGRLGVEAIKVNLAFF